MLYNYTIFYNVLVYHQKLISMFTSNYLFVITQFPLYFFKLTHYQKHLLNGSVFFLFRSNKLTNWRLKDTSSYFHFSCGTSTRRCRTPSWTTCTSSCSTWRRTRGRTTLIRLRRRSWPNSETLLRSRRRFELIRKTTPSELAVPWGKESSSRNTVNWNFKFLVQIR